MSATRELSHDEVARHCTKDDCWIIIVSNGIARVYDITKFLPQHPGGPEIVLDFAGKDATEAFEDIGHSINARALLDEYLIGISTV